MQEKLTERQKALLAADDKARAVKPVLAQLFKEAALPVESIGTLSSGEFPDPYIGLGVILSRSPTQDETKLLPLNYEGVPIKYSRRRKSGSLDAVGW